MSLQEERVIKQLLNNVVLTVQIKKKMSRFQIVLKRGEKSLLITKNCLFYCILYIICLVAVKRQNFQAINYTLQKYNACADKTIF